MDYISLTLELHPFQPYSEILISELADAGFESFDDNNPPQLISFCPKELFNKANVELIIDELKNTEGLNISEVNFEEIKSQNWNATWESSFNPIEIENKIIIRAPFHNLDKNFDYDIVIQPKMSFGTGHHETTFMMMSNMLSLNLKNAKVLDMGTGTGVLAILANKLGAGFIDTYDIDDWSIENAKENFNLNNCSDINIAKADIEEVANHEFDVILANINKNVLTYHIPYYAKLLKKGGKLLLSGFFVSDVNDLEKICNLNNLILEKITDKNTWACLIFTKKD